ncbi:two-component system response regulator [Rhizobium sp. Root274]|uniref:response regulator n=1 Tax=unclassified Rhizobium TaxID=2613769 RepID=UPI000715A56D|nr:MULTISPECIES: response regulator [unclassified Rhizobium]KQW29762.1 two-component system response regulator [Rhizobium sp. Root1240]KRD29953.1 two-component system response regulator [Rhizobium sp. Root274]
MTKTRLLVVEDDGLIRLDLVDMLTDQGFDVLDAANADEALSVLEGGADVAAVLTDIDMPGSMNGLALASRVHTTWPGCRIAVISGRYHPEPELLPNGARFLTKPLSEAVILRLLRELDLLPTA